MVGKSSSQHVAQRGAPKLLWRIPFPPLRSVFVLLRCYIVCSCICVCCSVGVHFVSFLFHFVFRFMCRFVSFLFRSVPFRFVSFVSSLFFFFAQPQVRRIRGGHRWIKRGVPLSNQGADHQVGTEPSRAAPRGAAGRGRALRDDASRRHV